MERLYHVFVARDVGDEQWAYQGGDFMGSPREAAENAVAAAIEPGTGDDGPYMFGEDSTGFALVVPATMPGYSRAYRVTERTCGEFPSYWLAICPRGKDPTKFLPEPPTLGHDVKVPDSEDDDTELARMKAGLEAISASGGVNPDGHLTERIVEVRTAAEAAHGLLEDARLCLSAASFTQADDNIERAMEVLRRAVPEGTHA